MSTETNPLPGRNILVTGGSRGIGKAVAAALASEGASVCISGRDPRTLTEAAEEIRNSASGRISTAASDLMKPDAPKLLIEQAAELLGGIDVLVNNAGIALSRSFGETTEEQWDALMTLNARAPFFLCQHALPHLRKSAHPAIVQIASVVSFKGYELQSAYTASKHALLGFTKTLSKEVQKDGIRVFSIAPGGVNTELVTSVRPDIDTSNLISPAEIADAVLFLLRMEGNAMIDELSIRRVSKPGWL